MKDKIIGTFLVLCGLSTLTGFFLTLYTDNPVWLLLCIPVVIFFS